MFSIKERNVMIVGNTDNPLQHRQVTCYNCSHKFTWIIRSHEGTVFQRLFLKETNTEGFPTTCPACNSDLYVFDGLDTALNEYDHRIKHSDNNGADIVIEDELILRDDVKAHEYLWTTEKDQWVLIKSDGYLIFNRVTGMALLVDNNELAFCLERVMIMNGNKIIEWKDYFTTEEVIINGLVPMNGQANIHLEANILMEKTILIFMMTGLMIPWRL